MTFFSRSARICFFKSVNRRLICFDAGMSHRAAATHPLRAVPSRARGWERRAGAGTGGAAPGPAAAAARFAPRLRSCPRPSTPRGVCASGRRHRRLSLDSTASPRGHLREGRGDPAEPPGGPCRAQPRAPRPAPPSPASAAPSARVPARGWQRPRHRRSLVFPAAGEHLDLCDLPSALPLPYGFIPQPLLLKRDSFRQHSSGSPAPGFRCLNPACATERDAGGRAARWGPSACAGGAGRAAGTCPS